ncbi:hypothetical protein LN042_07435 [Kitasatospora sp. RB6PN24]|uniref:hypothetical protein n=1 Tax=Kitasatospora humi TaxID=2893891 RepID=UPI001E37C120|nr:hypothetical protein [Kitasatospora humi]MCC9306939.1 hypothetical protein [Kitasatospora humi]
MSGSDNQAEPDRPARRRGSGRHAAPRERGRNRAKLLGAAAVPTALLMAATVAPELAHAATAGATANCTPAATPTTTVTPVPKSSLTPLPGPGTSAATTGGQPAAGTPAAGTPSAATTGSRPDGTPAAGTPSAATPNADKPGAATPAAAGGGSAGSRSVAATGTSGHPAAAPAAESATRTGAAPQQAATDVTRQAVQAAATQPGTQQSQDLLGTILGGIAGIFDPGHQNQQTPPPSPAGSPSPRGGTASPSTASPSAAAPRPSSAPTASAPAPAAPAPRDAAPVAPGATPAPGGAGTANTPGGAGATGSPSAAAASDGPGATPSGSATAGPSPSDSASPTGTASPSAVASALANGDARPLCPVDTSKVAASGALTGNVVPDQSWTLHTTKLSLYGAVFGGVYEVHSPTRTYRVLKFTVSSVDIDNLDMSTIENTAAGGDKAKTLHVKGGPGTTSTMRNGPITMYVESLSGELASLYGIPLPPLGTITLTPDTLPEWLYDLIGAIPIPLDMSLTGVKAVQAGQFGGDLHIPGMHLYNDDQPYDGL